MKTKILFLILLTAPLGLSAKVAEASASAGASIDSISPNPDSKYESGKNFLHGRGVEKNPEKAIEHFKKAADLGHRGSRSNWIFLLRRFSCRYERC